jgi:deoxyribose-phosphate aldolase
MTEEKKVTSGIKKQLQEGASWEEVTELCEEAIRLGEAVCVPPCYVAKLREIFPEQLRIGTIAGYPFGYSAMQAKAAEVRQAIADGADTITVAVNVCDIRNHDFMAAGEEIRILRQAAGSCTLRAAAYTGNLKEEERAYLKHCLTEAGANQILESAGFGIE